MTPEGQAQTMHAKNFRKGSLMSVYLARGFGAALVYAVAAQAAQADLTAQDVWSDTKSYLTAAGYTVTGDEQGSGNVLTISNMALEMSMPEDGSSFGAKLDRLIFTENGDGTVSIDMPNSLPMTFTGGGNDEEPVSGVVTFTQTGNTMVASGVPDDFLYTYTATNAGFDLTSLVVDGEPVPLSAARVSVDLDNLASSTRIKLAEQRNYTQRFSADTLSYDLAFDDPDSDDRGSYVGSINGVGFDGSGAIPIEMDPSSFDQMLADGFAVDGAFSYASGNADLQGIGDGKPFAVTSASQGGKVAVKMDASQIAYDVQQNQTALTMTGADLPFPVAFQAATTAFKIAIPVSKSDTDQDFAVGVTLTDFTMSDMLWAMFDPAAQLPRDPAKVALDLTGKTKVLFNFLDPTVAASLEDSGESPFEVNALTINNLLVSMVGASLSGTGDFTFDNTDLVSYDGFPRPAGYVDLKLVGANGLIDKLTSMGFVGDEEAMGARMMMGMLAVPGDSPDTMTSKIEINDQGHVSANGQRIK